MLRRWWADHRDWPRDTWFLMVGLPLLVAVAMGVFQRSVWLTALCLAFYIMGMIAARVYSTTARAVEHRRALIRIRSTPDTDE